MSCTKVAVVTGSNKGIGFAIVRSLCKKFPGDVFLTARDEGCGIEAVSHLQKEGLHPKFHQLDIDDAESVGKLAAFLKQQYGGLDVLVNNAGIAYKNTSTAPALEQAEVTNKTNYFSTLDVCTQLFPLLRPHARVCSVSSMCSKFAYDKCSPEVQARVRACANVEDVSSIIHNFIESRRAGVSKGFAPSNYGMSKLGVRALTIIQQRIMDADPRQDIIINCCCPGYCDTDMTNHKGPLSSDQGAEIPVYLALLPENADSPRGKYITDWKIEDWDRVEESILK